VIKRSYIKIPVLILSFLGAGLIGLALFFPHFIDVNSYRNEIVAGLRQALQREVDFGHGQFSMDIDPAFTFDNVSIKELDGTAPFFNARRVSIRVALLPLLKKKIILKKIVVDGADIYVRRDSDGKLNIDDLLRSKPGAYQLRVKSAQINKSVLRWRDMFVGKQMFSAEAQIENFFIDGISRGRKGAIKLVGVLPALSGASSNFALSGTIGLPAANRSLHESELDLSCRIKQFEAGRFWPYYGRFIPFESPGGRVDFESDCKGKIKEIKSKGIVRFSNMAINWSKVFHHPVNPKLAQLKYEIALNENSVDMPVLDFSADGFRVNGRCSLQDIRSKDLRIIARVSSEPLKLEKFRQWIPYGIIDSDVSEYIEEHIVGGVFKLESASLDGRISQIFHMDQGTNYNVLNVKVNVTDGKISYGPKIPEFTNIKAEFGLIGRDFVVNNGTGTFGKSPFKMSGRITDYPFEPPSLYPFDMEINPGESEVSWLAALAGLDKLEYSGGSRLVLKGSGGTSSYSLTGAWDLKQAEYSVPGIIQKASDVANDMTFAVNLSPSSVLINSLTYELSPFSLSAKAQLKYGAKRPVLGFEVQTNEFHLSDAFPLFSRWQSYHPQGNMKAYIKASGDPADFASMNYNGSISLRSFSFKPGEKFKSINNINGMIAFNGHGLETSNVTAYYGKSRIRVMGKIRDLSNPKMEIALSSPEINLHDVSTTVFKPEARIRKMFASFVAQDNTYTIRNFSGQINSTVFKVSGNYTAGALPQATLSVYFPKLNLNDLVVLAQNGKGEGAALKTDLKIDLIADKGQFENILFSDAKLLLSRDSGATYIQKLEGNIYDGKFTAKGRIAPDAGGVNRYDLNFGLERVNADHLYHALNVTREITGTLDLSGNITARGANLSEIRGSALGNVQLHMENGMMRKFNVLSKVFSILNVSQLLRFRLPDMVQDGMPYNEIKATFSIRDGVAATEDMLVRGNAINMSIVGRADVVKEELNFIIGVQPLQTVDKIVSRIPVVGWLLTGNGNALVTAYFEAKGKWSDPQVTAIPVQSISKGIFKIFRRVFELPMRLFTDSGAVFLGE